MIRDKIFLILGIVLLSSGILLRLLTDYSILPKLIILTGIAFKYLYLSAIIKNYGYKVGKEFIVLSIGLVLFLTGLILKNNNYNCIYGYFLFGGIILKISFITIFVIKKNKLNH